MEVLNKLPYLVTEAELVERKLEAANATLDRVRAELESVAAPDDKVRRALAALASQPEAPAAKGPAPDVQGWIDRALEAERDLAAANATLERVRAVLAEPYPTQPIRLAIEAAFAGLLEARCECVGCRNGFAYCEVQDSQRDAANAKIAELEAKLADVTAVAEAHVKDNVAMGEQLERRGHTVGDAIGLRSIEDMYASALGALSAANARADAAERKERDLRHGNEFLSRTLGQESARADAAERSLNERDGTALTRRLETDRDSWKDLWVKEKNRADAAERDHKAGREQAWTAHEKLKAQLHRTETERDQLAQKLDAAETDRCNAVQDWHDAVHERDQLAARVTELEENAAAFRDALGRCLLCTPEERKVLEACAWGHDDMLRKVLDMAGYSAWVRMVIDAELANRAAKAKVIK